MNLVIVILVMFNKFTVRLLGRFVKELIYSKALQILQGNEISIKNTITGFLLNTLCYICPSSRSDNDNV